MTETSKRVKPRWAKYRVTGVWNSQYGFGCYATDMSSGRKVAVVGNEPLALSRGDVVRGQVAFDKDWHGTPMFRMERYVPAYDRVAVVRYMRDTFYLGEVISDKIYALLGGDVAYDLITNTDSCIKRMRGLLSISEIQALRKRINEVRDTNAVKAAYPFLSLSLTETLIAEYGKAKYALDKLNENPYSVAFKVKGFSMTHADRVFFANGHQSDDPMRTTWLLLYALRTVLNEKGDTYLNASDAGEFAHWLDVACEMSGKAAATGYLSASFLATRVNDLVDTKMSVREQDADGNWLFCLRSMVNAERRIADYVRDASQLDPIYTGDGKTVARDIDQFYRMRGIVDSDGEAAVDGYQWMAVENALLNRVSVITGGPGRGKTLVASCICSCWSQRMGGRIYLTSYTGKATARLGEMVKGTDDERVICRTMSSLLMSKYVGPGSLDGCLVIIDEMSMVDTATMGQFVDYLKGAQVVIIGDANQLPSIGNGQVLRDLLDCGVFPVTELVTCYRSKGAMTLVRNGDAIVENRLDDLAYDNSFSWSRGTSPFDDIVREYTGLLAKGFEPSDVCLLGAFKSDKDPFSIVNLNIRLRDKVNPNGTVIPGLKYHGTDIRVGDRVIIVDNLPEADAVNGDVGTLESYYGDSVVITLDKGADITLTRSDFPSIELGYALTVHKSQGSEYKRILLAVSPRLSAPWAANFATRNLMYTAVTRAKDAVTLFGSQDALRVCLANEMAPRHTRLCEFIAEAMAEEDDEEE